MEPPVPQVQRVAAGSGALREEHALGLGRLEVHRRGDRERAPPNVHGDGLRDLGRSRVVDVAVTRRARLRPHVRDDLERGPVVERQALVDPRVVPPQSLQLLELLGVLGGQVVDLGAVLREVVELPLVELELPPSGDRRVQRVREPALVVERSHPEHRVELGLPPVGGRVRQRGRDALPLDRALGVALEHLRRLDAEHLVQRRDEVHRVDVLVAHAAARVDPLRPGHEQGIRHAALVAGEALPVRERRVERPRPAGVVVVVGARAAQLVEALEVRLDAVGRRC